MRIVAGRLSGRNFDPSPGHRTHPMSEKIRGALFNSLGDINGLTILDPYAGTGAIIFEAISRGASSAVALDVDSTAHKTIISNIDKLGISDQVEATRAAAIAWARRHPNHKFDIVVLDPPYDAVVPKELLALSKHVVPGGVIVLSLPPRSNGFMFAPSRQELLSHKNYGDADLYFYRQL